MNYPSCDRAAVLTYLQLLGYQNGARCFFRCFFPHGHARKENDKGRSIETQFPDIPVQALENYQKEGRGCYVVVNGYGTSDKEVSCGKALFIEHDRLETHVQQRLWEILKFPQPTFQVETGGKSIHSYWVFLEPVPIAPWKDLQADLLEWADADPTIKNPSRVMRLPGCWYMDREGMARAQTKIVAKSGTTYAFHDLRKLVPIRETVERTPNWYDFERSFRLPFNRSVPIEICLSRHSRSLLEGGAPEGIRRDRAIALAKDLIGTTDYLGSIGQSYNGDPLQLMHEYASRCSPPYDEIDIDWGFVNKQSASPCLRPEQIEGCIKAWAWKEYKNEYPQQSLSFPSEFVPDFSDPEADEPEVPKLARAYQSVEKKLKCKLRLNTLTKEIELDGEVLDPDEIELILALDYNISVPHNKGIAIAASIARQNSYSPVEIYLKQARDKYKDTSILEDLASRYFGTSEPIYNTYLAKTLVSAVARALNHGCQVESVLILKSGQGAFKSSFLKVLASEEWFDNSMTEMSDIDERRKLHTVWIVEWAEIEEVFKRRNAAKIKSFISCATDRIRNPFGRQVKMFKRPSIFVGTTNETHFLADHTGDRRFWVVPVQKPIDLDLVRSERDRIWAAAVHLYQSGYKWHLTREEEIQADLLKEDYRLLDPWHETIEHFADRFEWVTIERILSDCIKLDLDRQTNESQRRVAKVLIRLGYESGRRKRDEDGRALRIWIKK